MVSGRGLKAIALVLPLALPVLTAASAYAASAKLPSFEAIYDLRLIEASSTGGPRAAVGSMEWRFVETCDGWETKTHTTMALHFANDLHTFNERFFESLESANGRKYVFSVKTVKNDMIEENFKGRASLERRGGQARYELHPTFGEEDAAIRMVNLNLPEGTLFPVAHTQALLAAADRGRPLHNSVLLSGSSSVGPRRMSVAIGPRNAPTPPDDPNIDPSVLGQPAWSMNTAMFNLFERRDTPNTEVFQHYYGSGIADSFEQTFRDFRISARLTRLKRIDPPKCK